MAPVLEYQSRRRIPFRWRRWLVLSLSVAGAFALAALADSRPYKTEAQRVCQECGIYQIETAYFGTFRSATDRKTPVFVALESTGHVPLHAHRFASLCCRESYLLGGRGWSCGIFGGPAYGNASNPCAGVLLDALYRWGDPVEADRWRSRLLDRDTARASGQELMALDVPFEPFATREDFQTWQRQAMPAR